MWLGRDHWAAGEGTVWPGGTWTEAAVKPWGKVGKQCTGEMGLGKHVTSTGNLQGGLRLGPCTLTF